MEFVTISHWDVPSATDDMMDEDGRGACRPCPCQLTTVFIQKNK